MSDKIFVKIKDVVIPGELLAEGMTFLPAGRAFRKGARIYAATIGIVDVRGRVIRVVPLSGCYMPKKDDLVIGRVINISRSGWAVDINCPYSADLNIGEVTTEYIDLAKTELSRYFDIDDYLLARITDISESKYVKLTAKGRPFRKLIGGNIINVSPTKIPRIIGKEGSMITMLKQLSDCDIVIGQNGLIWIKGTPQKEMMVAQAIKKIERESHLTGLTDKIKIMLSGKK